MSDERQHCGDMAEAWLFEHARSYTRLDGDRIASLADLLQRERKAAYDEGFSEGMGVGANSIMACTHE